MTSYFPLCLFVVVALAFITCDAQLGSIMGKLSPLVVNEEEKELCKFVAETRGYTLIGTKKIPKKTCEVICKVEGGDSITIYSPEGTLCCDMVGVGPTGRCNGNGKCNVFLQ